MQYGATEIQASTSTWSTGRYRLRVTDSKNCVSAERDIDVNSPVGMPHNYWKLLLPWFLFIYVYQPIAIGLSATQQPATCSYSTNGQIIMTATGGNGGYIYRVFGNSLFSESQLILSIGWVNCSECNQLNMGKGNIWTVCNW